MLADDVLASVQPGNYALLPKFSLEFQSDAAFFATLNCFVLWPLHLDVAGAGGWEDVYRSPPKPEGGPVVKVISNRYLERRQKEN